MHDRPLPSEAEKQFHRRRADQTHTADRHGELVRKELPQYQETLPARGNGQVPGKTHQAGGFDAAPLGRKQVTGVSEQRPNDHHDRVHGHVEPTRVAFREKIQKIGLDVRPGAHPITPVMLGEAPRAHRMADRLLDEGIYVIGFSHPVVPQGEARIRVQVSAAHDREDLDRALDAFQKVAGEMAGAGGPAGGDSRQEGGTN